MIVLLSEIPTVDFNAYNRRQLNLSLSLPRIDMKISCTCDNYLRNVMQSVIVYCDIEFDVVLLLP